MKKKEIAGKIKFALKISVLVCAVFFILFFVLISDFGQRMLLSCATQFLKTKNIVLEVTDFSNSKADKVIFTLPDKSKMTIDKISINRDTFFSRLNITAEKITFVASGSQKTNEDFPVDALAKAVTYVSNIKKIVHRISLGNGCIKTSGKRYELSKIEYLSGKTKDYFVCATTDGAFVSATWNENNKGKGKIEFNNFFGIKGNIEIKNANNNTSFYKLKLDSKTVSIKSDGHFQNFREVIFIDETFVEYQKKVYIVHGEAHLNEKQILLSSSIDLDKYLPKLPNGIDAKGNFSNVIADVRIHYFLENRKNSKISVIFLRENNKIGDIQGTLQKDNLNLNGNLSWINLYGYKIDKLDCKISDFTRADIVLSGENFTLTTSINNNVVQSWKFSAEGFGTAQSTQPIIVSSNANIAGKIKFSKLEFFEKILPISGDITGTFSYKNGECQTDFHGISLKFASTNIVDYEIVTSGSNIRISAKNISWMKSNLQDINFDIQKEQMKLTGRLNNNSLVSFYGTISDSFKKISINKGLVESHETKCNFKKCDINFATTNYNVLCEVSHKKSKKVGAVSFNYSADSMHVNFGSFQPNLFSRIFDFWVPKCDLNGNIQLKKTNGIFVGEAHLLLSGLLSGHIEIDGSLNSSGVKISTQIKNRKDKLIGNLSLPVILDQNGKITKNFSTLPIEGHFFGTTNLERLFELSDKSDARGILNCNLKISGTFNDPQINGTLTLQKAHFIIGDVFLRNGDIAFACVGNKITVTRAKFIDTKKKELTVTGSGKFFFDDIIPNIQTNLNLLANRFTLFDSDDMKIAVSGTGKIVGRIDDLLISGDVEVVKCKIRKVDTASTDSNDGIVIENEINVNLKKNDSENDEQDFCRYNIAMHCPKISVSGNVFDMIFGGDLRLVSYNRKASLIGTLQLQKGKLELFGKRLIMTKGVVEFFEKYPFNPRVSILCENNFADMLVHLKIKNRPEKGGTFELSSTPSYSQEIILSQMLFGKELKYLSVTEAAQFAQAMSSFRQTGYIFSIMNTFKKIGIIDSISFSNSNNQQGKSLNTNTQTASNKSNMNVSAGKYIGDKLFISVNRNSDETTSFDIDYSITSTISVKANTNGEAGISWKYKY